MSQVRQLPITLAVLLVSVLTVAFPAYSADTLNSIEVPEDRAYPESTSAAPDGTLYVSSLASGGIARIKPGASKAEPWIKPGAFEPARGKSCSNSDGSFSGIKPSSWRLACLVA